MTKKHHPIDQLSTASARQARADAAMLRHDLRALRDHVSGRNHALKAPKIATKRQTSKTTTNAPLADILTMFGDLSTLGTNLLGSTASFYASAAQRSAQANQLLSQAQRNR